MSWREPWRKPKPHQAAMCTVAASLGLLLVSPWWIGVWSRWDELVVLENQMQTQKQMTVSLHSQTEQLQRSMPNADFRRVDAQSLMVLAPANALKFSRSHQEAQVVSPHLHALHVQLMPMRFDLEGTWVGWLAWLKQWPAAAPGVTLSSLTLKSNTQGDGLTMQLVAVAAQRVEQRGTKGPISIDATHTQTEGVLFDVQHWEQAKHRQAQAHVSYAQQVAPELLRGQEPLERYAREHLHYVGQISSGVEVQALIRVHDPAGPKFAQVHRVRLGSHAGQNFGRVSAISAEYLLLDELLLASSGEWHRQEVRMPLQERLP